MHLAETLQKLRSRLANGDDVALRAGAQLPSHVPYGSTYAAKALATWAFPSFAPTLFMWIDTGVRATRCQACGRSIPKQTERLAVHAISSMGREMKSGGRKMAERSYYHVSCFDESLVTGRKPRNSRDCFDCGAAPAPNCVFLDRVWIGDFHDPGYLCLECRGNSWRYMCSACGVHYRRNQCTPRHMDEPTRSRAHQRTTVRADADSRDGRYYVCRFCLFRYADFHDLQSEAQHAEALEAERAEIRVYEDYRRALAQGERPAVPAGYKLDPDDFHAQDLF